MTDGCCGRCRAVMRSLPRASAVRRCRCPHRGRNNRHNCRPPPSRQAAHGWMAMANSSRLHRRTRCRRAGQRRATTCSLARSTIVARRPAELARFHVTGVTVLRCFRASHKRHQRLAAHDAALATEPLGKAHAQHGSGQPVRNRAGCRRGLDGDHGQPEVADLFGEHSRVAASESKVDCVSCRSISPESSRADARQTGGAGNSARRRRNGRAGCHRCCAACRRSRSPRHRRFAGA
jgi:hypothetical protein